MSAASPAPWLSIILPVYNAAPHLAAAIESVLAQTRSDWELIVVDDGSTDDLHGVAAAYNHDSRVRVLRQANQGPSAARNTGLQHATGALVAFLDADDSWQTTYLARMAAALESDPAAVLALAGWQYIDASGKRLPQAIVLEPTQIEQVRADLAWRNPLVPSAVVVRRSALAASGGFDTELFGVEDWDLWLRLRTAGAFVAVPEALVGYRTHAHNLSSNVERMARERGKLHDKHLGPLRMGEEAAGQPRRWAAGYTLFEAALNYWRDGDEPAALARLQQAVQLHPGLLAEDAFYYELACVFQPAGYRGTPAGLRLHDSAPRLRHTLTHHLLVPPGQSRMHLWGHACLCLAQLAYLTNDRPAALGYARQALRYAAPQHRIQVWRTLMRVGLPRRVVGTLRAVRASRRSITRAGKP